MGYDHSLGRMVASERWERFLKDKDVDEPLVCFQLADGDGMLYVLNDKVRAHSLWRGPCWSEAEMRSEMRVEMRLDGA